MARGWESKAVEAQLEAAETENKSNGKEALTPAEIELQREKQGLLLTRARVTQQLENTSNPRYSQMLKDELRALDARLSSFVK